jgi:hypothetical protein
MDIMLYGKEKFGGSIAKALVNFILRAVRENELDRPLRQPGGRRVIRDTKFWVPKILFPLTRRPFPRCGSVAGGCRFSCPRESPRGTAKIQLWTYVARKLLSNKSPIWGMCLTRTVALRPEELGFLGFHSKKRGDFYSLAGLPLSSKGAGAIFLHSRCDPIREGETEWENL